MSFISDLLVEISSFRIRVGNKLNTLADRIGTLTNLTTTNKNSLVEAVNEVNSKADVANSMFLPLAGGTMTGAINWNSGSPFLQYLGNNRIRFSTNNTILSADAAGTANGGIYLRPQGDA